MSGEDLMIVSTEDLAQHEFSQGANPFAVMTARYYQNITEWDSAPGFCAEAALCNVGLALGIYRDRREAMESVIKMVFEDWTRELDIAIREGLFGYPPPEGVENFAFFSPDSGGLSSGLVAVDPWFATTVVSEFFRRINFPLKVEVWKEGEYDLRKDVEQGLQNGWIGYCLCNYGTYATDKKGTRLLAGGGHVVIIDRLSANDKGEPVLRIINSHDEQPTIELVGADVDAFLNRDITDGAIHEVRYDGQIINRISLDDLPIRPILWFRKTEE
jgi:hypothetical protein